MSGGGVASAPTPVDSGSRIGRVRGVPLRVSLVALTLILVVLGLGASGVAVTSAMRADLIDRTDESLRTAMGGWARPDDVPRGPILGPGPRRPPSQFLIWVTTDDGLILSNRADFAWAPDLDGLTATSPVTVGSTDHQGPDWRVLRSEASWGQTVVAIELDDVDATLSRLIWLQVGIGLVVVLVIGALSYLLVRTSLRPLRRVEETAHAIAAGDLDMRVPSAPANTEVGSLSESLNTMLGQIERAFAATADSERQARASEEQMRRFVADAGHELRTPLTSIKGFAELYRQGGVPDVSDAMRRIDDEAGRMNVLVEDLLVLARLDAHRPMTSEPVDLLATCTETVAMATVSAPDRAIALDLQVDDDPPVVAGDPHRLMQVVRNLVTNAVVHTPADAAITVGLRTDRDHRRDDVVLTVADTGPGISPEDAPHVFERFYRGDTSRHRGDGGGSGLGLSIVAALVAAHGGTVGVEPTPGGGATFWVRLPRLAA